MFVSEALKTLLVTHDFTTNANLTSDPDIYMHYDDHPALHSDNGEIKINEDTKVGNTEWTHHRNESYRILVDVRYDFNHNSILIDTTTNTITFATLADTITRANGSWTDNGFMIGDRITVEGSSLNDPSTYYTITNISDLIISVAENLVDETIIVGSVEFRSVGNSVILGSLVDEVQSMFDTENTTVDRDFFWSFVYTWVGNVRMGHVMLSVDAMKQWVVI